MKKAVFVAAAFLALVCAPVVAAGRSFDLRVNDVSGLDEPWPLVGGLPFPEGELRDASRIRIVDAQGREVPAQIDVVATWRDGSIRWALAGFTASPQGECRVEFGPGVSRSEPERPLRVEDADGRLTIDTGAAIYEFLPDRLLPESARMGDTEFLSNAGDGAYLVDNHGRLSRVAGELAEVETELLKQGPARVVVRREGWYVTDDGERVARAKAWFYFAAGTPHLKITHSLVLTEDTNELWVRDYGLEFGAPEAPETVVFAHREAEGAEKMEALAGVKNWENVGQERKLEFARLFSGAEEREWKRFSATPKGGEVYLLQDVYPHFLERDCRAVIGRVGLVESGERASAEGGGVGHFWVEPWLEKTDVAGDWGDASYSDNGLTVVVPWLAQQFPKEIAFGSGGARVALWSGRSGRELDLRLPTLIDEYWQSWATENTRARRLGGLDNVVEIHSNAQGVAPTHDIWLLPRSAAVDDQRTSARARAASNPPLLQPDPRWLSGTGAIGWPVHPRDEQRFPEEEEEIETYWNKAMTAYAQLRRTGFIDWGKHHTLRHAKAPWYRESGLADYGLRKHVWGLYGRSGDRRYWEYASRFNRYAGAWATAHWTAGDKFEGGSAYGHPPHLPVVWGEQSVNFPGGTGGGIDNWLLEYYFTGNEHVMELVRMNAEAIKQRWDGEALWPHGPPAVNTLASAYTLDWDEELGRKIRDVVHGLINLDNPNGFEDESSNARFGALYKDQRNAAMLYSYYLATGDQKARQAFLKAMDYNYRFNRLRHPRDGQNFAAFNYSIAYKWTGNVNYLRVVNAQLEQAKEVDPSSRILENQHPTLSIPAALTVIAEVDGPIEPFPLLSSDKAEDAAPILFRKEAGQSVNMGMYLRLAEHEEEDAAPEVVVESAGSRVEVELEVEKAFHTRPSPGRRDPRGRHVSLKVPAQAREGAYTLRLPNAEKVVLLDSDAKDTRLAEEE